MLRKWRVLVSILMGTCLFAGISYFALFQITRYDYGTFVYDSFDGNLYAQACPTKAQSQNCQPAPTSPPPTAAPPPTAVPNNPGNQDPGGGGNLHGTQTAIALTNHPPVSNVQNSPTGKAITNPEMPTYTPSIVAQPPEGATPPPLPPSGNSFNWTIIIITFIVMVIIAFIVLRK